MNEFKDKLDKIAEIHSYMDGFNGRLTKYRIMSLDEHLEIDDNKSNKLNVLEIGTGEGPITQYLAETFNHVVSVEPAKAFYEKAKNNLSTYPHVTLYNSTIEDIELTDKFDLIVCAGVLEHVENLSLFFEKINVLLKSKGAVYFTVPNATSIHRRIGVEMKMIPDVKHLGELDIKVGHQRYFDFKEMEQTFIDHQYDQIECHGIMLKPFPNSKMDELNEDYCDALYEVGKEIPEYCAEIFLKAKLK